MSTAEHVVAPEHIVEEQQRWEEIGEQEQARRREKLQELRQSKRPWDALMVVGCGGNYWYVQNYLLARLHGRIQRSVFIDPDRIEQRNWGRQWVGAPLDTPKVELAAAPWSSTNPIQSCNPVRNIKPFQLGSEPLTENGLLILCLPDNDQARLDTCVFAEDLLIENKADHVAVLVAGTNWTAGQAYYGIATRRDSWLHDFREVHEGEIDEDGGRTEGCGQSAMSNYMTGVCTGRALDEILDATDGTVSEWYWAYDTESRQTRIHRREV